MVDDYQEIARKGTEVSLIEEFYSNKTRFFKYDFRRNNCSNVVKEFLSLLGIPTPKLTPWADTIRHLGEIKRNPWDLQVGDVVAMGRPGDTHHVGVYMGNGKVLHQSGVRGYRVGIFEDLRAFVNHRAGFYFVRPDYSVIQQKPVEGFVVAPEPLIAPAIDG